MKGSLVLRFMTSLAFCSVVAVSAHAQEPNDGAKVWSSSEVKWQNDKTLPSVQSVPLWGNPASGEHGMLRKFPAGYAPPCTSIRRWSGLLSSPAQSSFSMAVPKRKPLAPARIQKSLQIPITQYSAGSSLLAYFCSLRRDRLQSYRALPIPISRTHVAGETGSRGDAEERRKPVPLRAVQVRYYFPGG
jgi:hypothetical protein